MSSTDYWEKRKAQRMWEYMGEAEETANQISKAYEKAGDYLEKEMDKIYMRYQSKHGLSDLEAKRFLQRMHDKTSFEEFRSLLKQATGTEKKELLAVIEAPAYASRIAKLQETQKGIDGMMRSIYHQELLRSKEHYADLANEAYYKTIYDVQKDTGIAFSFSETSKRQIDKLLKSKWSGINYSKRIWNNTQTLGDNLKQELLVGLMTGRSDREVCEIIRHRFTSGAMEARRLVRTESCYIANEMEGQAYEESGIDRYMFVATLDKKTSKVCQELDHKVFAVKDRKPGENYPPMHPWCRSTTIAYLDDDILEDMTRKARDPETGRTYSVPGNMSYEDWKEKYVDEADQKERLTKLKEFYAMDDKHVKMKVTQREANIVKNDFESAIIFDSHGNVLLKKTGEDHAVGFSEDELKLMKDAVVTHNHPSGVTFSPDDIYMAMEYDMQELRATTKDRGTYVLRRNENLHLMPSFDAFVKEYKALKKRYKIEYKGKFPNIEDRIHRERVVQANAINRLANKYGLLYRREK